MNEIKLESQQQKIAGYLEGYYVTHLIEIGNELGIFQAIWEETDGVTISRLASKLSLHEPYLKIWCQTAYYKEILDIDGNGLVKLAPYFDTLLADSSGMAFIANRIKMAIKVHADRLRESPPYYYSGGYETEYSSDRSDIVAAATRSPHRAFVSFLSALAEEDRLKSKLSQPFRYLDIGCGQGSFLIQMAKTFPKGRYFGIDPIKHGIEAGRREILENHLDHIITLESGAAESMNFLDEFDIVGMVVTFHEIMSDARRKVMEQAYQSLKSSGLLLIVDFAYPSEIGDFRNKAFGPGIMDQFFETTLGVRHLCAEEQEAMFTEAGFKDFNRVSVKGIDFFTAGK